MGDGDLDAVEAGIEVLCIGYLGTPVQGYLGTPVQGYLEAVEAGVEVLEAEVERQVVVATVVLPCAHTIKT